LRQWRGGIFSCFALRNRYFSRLQDRLGPDGGFLGGQRVSAVVNLVDELAQREGFSGLTPLMVKVLRDLRW
jgi:hypothetical protein